MTRKLRRGFKSEAEQISTNIREELGLDLTDRLDCHDLAGELCIPVLALPELEACGASRASVRRLLGRDAGFSALTICVGTRRLIVFNPKHSPGRRANSLAHELSHVLLEHPPAPALADGGCRHWDEDLEAEADWLGGTLLVPRDGALNWMRNGGSIELGAEHFGVSKPLFRWRVNHTGVLRQLRAATRYP